MNLYKQEFYKSQGSFLFEKREKLKFLDLFAGIGGFRLGMESQGHECLGFCEIISGNNFYVENLDYSKMQEKKPLEEKSDGSGYKSRKNYGESLLYASPAMVIATLQEKLSYQNIDLVKLSTFDTKLSQINHITGQYTKVSLSEKYRNINGFNINRRLYTAFLLSQFDGDLEFKNITTDNFT